MGYEDGGHRPPFSFRRRLILVSRIYVYRHADVVFDAVTRVPMSDFRIATDLYNTAPIGQFLPPQPIPNCDYVVTSNLRRSPETAIDLFGFMDVSDRTFREAELPDMPHWSFKAKPTTFFKLARLLWLLGRSVNCESRTKFNVRVENAADILIRAAGEHKAVGFIGHGWFNRSLVKALQRKGFSPQEPPQHIHGTYTLYTDA